ncbi:Hypothetical protein PHPALM_7956 [Phytophthora palmivora]|uniref:Uncharacterized protein n=1 Tax=Phytophthora palmivora TaxID=4796 RepID=A0A2P4YB11_9STRA|nr:Hypothetical protein PHPALM_7956 [Phytophthora palmivora]
MCANTGIPANKIVADLNMAGINVAEFDGIDDESSRVANVERFPTYTSPAIQVMLPVVMRLTLDGAIILASGFVTIDRVEFTLSRDTDVSFGINSVEITDNDTFIDLNGDCRASYLDSVIYLFAKDSSTPIFSADDRNANDFIDDGSISYRDPYKSIFLKKGAYILTIAPTGTETEDALAGKAKVNDAPELYTCRTHSSYGPYRLKISSTVGSTPFQFTRLPATTGIDPTQCHKTAEVICPS